MLFLDSLFFSSQGCLIGNVLIFLVLVVVSQISLWRQRQKNAQLQCELDKYQTNENIPDFQALTDVLPFSLSCQDREGRLTVAKSSVSL